MKNLGTCETCDNRRYAPDSRYCEPCEIKFIDGIDPATNKPFNQG